MPPISIIIPTFNRAHLLARAIQSVISQTSSEWELIIVDDGSTDNTKLLVKDFLGDKIRYFYQENHGANRARNLGAKNAAGPFLSFLDSDDELFPNWVGTLGPMLKNDFSI